MIEQTVISLNFAEKYLVSDTAWDFPSYKVAEHNFYISQNILPCLKPDKLCWCGGEGRSEVTVTMGKHTFIICSVQEHINNSAVFRVALFFESCFYFSFLLVGLGTPQEPP